MEATVNNTISMTPYKPGITATFTKLIVDKQRQYLVGMAAYIGLCVVFGLIFGLVGSQGGSEQSMLYGIISTLFASRIASMSFSDMCRSQDRLAILMQPASVAAKIWPRFLVCTVATAILIFAGYCTLEAGRIISFNLMYHQSTPFSWPTIVEYDGSYLIGWLIVTNFLLFNQAVFFFGGILWPKASAIKTMAVCMALLALLIGGISSSMYLLYSHGYVVLLTVSENALMWIINSVMLASTILLLWLTYRRFKNSTILYGLIQK